MSLTGITGIVPYTYYNQAVKLAGSTFLRVDGLIDNAPDFEVFRHGEMYDNLIFQKSYWLEMMELFRGPKILDLSDPDWIRGEVDLVETGALVDAITCSSPELTDVVRKYVHNRPVICVPDRINSKRFPPLRKPHTGRANNVVWFGFVNNAYETLPFFAEALKRFNCRLTIIADRPYLREDAIGGLKPEFIPYNQSTVYAQLQQQDIVLNHRSAKAFFKYKSNNKTIISLKLGVPVAHEISDLELLLDPAERNRQVQENQLMVQKEYDIIKSAEQYRQIIGDIRKGRLTAPGSRLHYRSF